MNKFGPTAQEEIKNAMRAMEKGQLINGNTGTKVTRPKQAVAIGLSKARKKGGKVPKKDS